MAVMEGCTAPALAPGCPVWAKYTGDQVIDPSGARLEWESPSSPGLLGATMNPLGDDLLPWLTLALGGALLVGNGLALIRPREEPKEGELPRAPLGRTVIQMAIGLVASIWALASLIG